MERDDADVLTAEYALGLLTEEERKACERLMLDDRDMRDRLAFWQERFSMLLPEASVTPPAHILSNLRAELFGEPEPGFWRDILHPKNRTSVIALGTAKVALIAAIIWLLFRG